MGKIDSQSIIFSDVNCFLSAWDIPEKHALSEKPHLDGEVASYTI